MNFLIDAQLPPALARLITALGHNAIHVEDAELLLALHSFRHLFPGGASARAACAYFEPFPGDGPGGPTSVSHPHRAVALAAFDLRLQPGAASRSTEAHLVSGAQAHRQQGAVGEGRRGGPLIFHARA